MLFVNLLDVTRASLRRMLRAPVGFAARWMAPKLVRQNINEFAVCAIFRDEAPFLDEWISFHAGVGAAHFYLYNNLSTDNFSQVLEPWIARGIVTLIEWPSPVGQLSAYEDCVKRSCHTYPWVAFIDIDEFLFSPQATDIRSILRHYRDLPGIEVWQTFFGSGGHDVRPALPVTEAYVKRAPLSRTTVKTIANPRVVYKVGVHQFRYWLGNALDPSRRTVVKGLAPTLDILRINHYWSRSLEDLQTKIRRGDASTPVPRDTDWHFDFEKTLNAETDEVILQVVRNIRTRKLASSGR
jgi:hypothetical protein